MEPTLRQRDEPSKNVPSHFDIEGNVVDLKMFAAKNKNHYYHVELVSRERDGNDTSLNKPLAALVWLHNYFEEWYIIVCREEIMNKHSSSKASVFSLV